MKTRIEMPCELKNAFLKFARKQPAQGPVPTRFLETLKTHTGRIAGGSNPYGPDENGLERRNPLIVAFGDSVTGGHFEFTRPLPEILAYWNACGRFPFPASVVDTQAVYHEVFRRKLMLRYPDRVVSVINAGIAGDTIAGMYKRVQRDVIAHQPDLVLLNGSLNWSAANGTDVEYLQILREVVRVIKAKTQADIILLTPNMEAKNPFSPDAKSTLPTRVKMIRQLAQEENVCLADVYRIWEDFAAQSGCEVAGMLANTVNHPTKAGHEVYAVALMKLMQPTR